eukprot:GHVL01010927.1.p1 GENE.GHVL01010927.1~~GHVL01010927.1.p1  ORF type:complete len:354 (+),score=59.70 GHVL01010927.1:389-1450(+)
MPAIQQSPPSFIQLCELRQYGGPCVPNSVLFYSNSFVTSCLPPVNKIKRYVKVAPQIVMPQVRTAEPYSQTKVLISSKKHNTIKENEPVIKLDKKIVPARRVDKQKSLNTVCGVDKKKSIEKSSNPKKTIELTANIEIINESIESTANIEIINESAKVEPNIHIKFVDRGLSNDEPSNTQTEDWNVPNTPDMYNTVECSVPSTPVENMYDETLTSSQSTHVVKPKKKGKKKIVKKQEKKEWIDPNSFETSPLFTDQGNKVMKTKLVKIPQQHTNKSNTNAITSPSKKLKKKIIRKVVPVSEALTSDSLKSDVLSTENRSKKKGNICARIDTNLDLLKEQQCMSPIYFNFSIIL